jgi:Zn-dependent alcohol dehydrogenase
MSKMAVVTEKSVVKIPTQTQESDLQYLAPFSCGYLTGAGTVLNEFRPDPDSSKIAIIGMGPVGFAGLLTAKAIGVKDLVAVDIVDSKLEMAASLTGSHTINTLKSPGGSLSEKLLAIYPEGVDYILDTTGRTAILQDSVKALAHGGTLALVGVPPPTGTIEVNALDLLLSCKRIVGVIEGAANPKTVRLL